jgi:protein-tyrosine-phosphatase
MNAPEKRKFQVLFICEGNTCRSPMAEAALKAKVPQTLYEDVEILSAGLSTFSGLAPSTEAELAAERKGYDLSLHQSQQLDETLVESSDLIFCMEPAQTQYLQDRFPQYAGRIHTLRMFGGGVNEPIEDPWQQNVRVYFQTLDQIDAEINRIKTKIWNLARKRKKELAE